MMTKNGAGFKEIDHTADWALHVWAPNFPLLFQEAARGMYWLMETTLNAAPRTARVIDLQGLDEESLLVAFLTELLYLDESERLGFDQYQIEVSGHRCFAQIVGAPIAGQKKEIKAVTYHNLEIVKTRQGLSVTIVFDV